jgi:hypothetical protein
MGANWTMASSDSPPPKETGEHLLQQIEGMAPLAKLIGFFVPGVRKQFAEVEKAMESVKAHREHLAQFARVYGPLGWTTYDRISTDLLAELAGLEPHAGEALLTSHHLDADTLRILSYRMRIPAYEPWAEVFERAVERATAEDYLSAVPLLLLTIDGICTTTTQKHPFSGGADAPVFDTITSGPGGIADGLKILGATRRKLSTEPISAPYRHGIVHGLEPNFGHAIVAAKAFNLLQAMVDYFDRRRDEAARLAKAVEEQRQPSWKEVAGGIRDLEAKKRALAAWKARDPVSGAVLAHKGESHTLDPQSPEAAAVAYLEALVSRNFGLLAKKTIDYPKRSLGYRAGRIRSELEGLTLDDWRIVGFRDEGAAMSVVDVAVVVSSEERTYEGELPMRLLYFDADNQSLVRGEKGGDWVVQPDFYTQVWVRGRHGDRSDDAASE